MKFYNVFYMYRYNPDDSLTSMASNVIIRKIPGTNDYLMRTDLEERFDSVRNKVIRIYRAESDIAAIKEYFARAAGKATIEPTSWVITQVTL